MVGSDGWMDECRKKHVEELPMQDMAPRLKEVNLNLSILGLRWARCG